MKKNELIFARNLTPLFLMFFCIGILFFAFLLLFGEQYINAASVGTSVTVGNSPPTFTNGPYEDPESSEANPTNVGSDVTFKATATDGNYESYYLLICSSEYATAVDDGPPTCDDTMWCRSSSTASGSQASCSRTTLQGDASSNAWWAFVCDANEDAASCSAGNQGDGATGSPFIVNHAPSFTAVSNNSPRNPGQTLTWSTTSSDPDGDDIKLIVCKTAGASGGSCTGDAWCTGSLTGSNATCTYNIPSVAPDGTFDAYVYIFDEFGFGATGAYQGSNVTFTINNVAPTVSAVTINGGSAINLQENTTKAVVVTATVSDNNSCDGGEIATVYAYLYRSAVTYGGCDTSGEANNNYCYPEVTCTQVPDTCSGPTDASADYTCTAQLQFHTDPTDADTQYPAQNWLSSVKAIDNNSGTGSLEVSVGVELNSLNAFGITSNINYGNLGAGQKNDPLDKTTVMTPTGNIGLDQELSGTNMCTDYPTCAGNVITVGNQKYALVTSTAYDSGTGLTSSPVPSYIRVPKALTTNPTTKSTWWGIFIPLGTQPGTYTGANTITSMKSDIAYW